MYLHTNFLTVNSQMFSQHSSYSYIASNLQNLSPHESFIIYKSYYMAMITYLCAIFCFAYIYRLVHVTCICRGNFVTPFMALCGCNENNNKAS